MNEGLDAWIAGGDLDELIREIDRRCDRQDWEGVEQVRRRSRAAIERGHQLWPAASFAEYRLALDAPTQWAAAAVTDGAGWMAPGPLAEVVAQHHTFAELADHLEHSPQRRVVAGERVIRGETVAEDAVGGGEMGGELPGHLMAWEPEYVTASYKAQGAGFPAPEIPPPEGLVFPADRSGASTDPPTAPDAEDGTRALADAVRHWSSQSEGTVRAAGADGDHLDALAALGVQRARWRGATMAEFGVLLAWAAADGAAHGRRRGAAAGRFELWWTLAVLTGVDDDWPTDPGGYAARLRFGLWLPDTAVTGWSCRLTVEDPEDGLAWALEASDAALQG